MTHKDPDITSQELGNTKTAGKALKCAECLLCTKLFTNLRSHTARDNTVRWYCLPAT